MPIAPLSPRRPWPGRVLAVSVLFAAAAFLHLHQLLGDRTYFRDT